MKRYILIPIFLLLVVIYSCKKVDDANRYNQSLPTVSGGGSYVTGDTITFNGRLFYETGTLKIHIGNADGKIVAHSQSSVNYYGNPTLFDQVKVVLTPEMGVGNNIPVTITANGHTIDAAPINISKFTPVTGVTDTTLFVDQLLAWKPADVSRYQYNDTVNGYTLTLPSFVRATVNASGDISFFNPVGVFKVNNAQVTPVVQAGDSFTENGQQFSIRYIVGATNTADPKTYYFSAEVLEANHDMQVSLVYRLCKFDATSGMVTTLNRSEVANFPDGISPIDPRPFQGTAASVKVVAFNLKAGANDDLFFLNSYSLGNYHYYVDDWHTLLTSQAVPRGYSHDNLCRYKNGKILSLFSDHSIVDDGGLQAPGVNSAAFDDYLLSPDGNAIIVTNTPGSQDHYMMYDLANNRPVYSIGDRTFKLKSFDNNPATRFPYNTQSLSINNVVAAPLPGLAFNFCMGGAILPNGDLVFKYTNSMGSFNFLANNGYCYAGEENGFGGNTSPQVTDIGKANHVNFYDKIVFGTDRSLNFYFFKPDNSSGTAGVIFYKMYSKK